MGEYYHWLGADAEWEKAFETIRNTPPGKIIRAHPSDRAGALRAEPQASQAKPLIPCAFEPVLFDTMSMNAYFKSLAHQFIEWANATRPEDATEHLLSSPRNAERLREAVTEMNRPEPREWR